MMGSLLSIEHFPLKKESPMKFFYQRNAKRGIVAAVIIHALALGTYWGVWWYQEQSRVYATRILDYADLGPPPALTDAPEMLEVPVEAPSRPVIGIPEPVDDAEVSAEMTIATQTEMSQQIAPVIQDIEEENIIIEAPEEENIVIEDEALPPPDAFTPHETPPAPVYQVQPEYPELARKAGIEGRVYIKILVDKEGKVRDALLVRGIGAGLDESALEAVRQWVYTPAIQNNRPVAVWVAQPVDFKLR
ncbi:MAG: energy transducer TonB [Gemmatimonadetes bacterium]|nr:energy transducer TonB [Gemmatimonadota bacterium]